MQGFTGVDPLAGKFPGWNPYNYTLNNPVRLIDPDGRAPMVPGEPPVGAVIAGTLRAAVNNILWTAYKYSDPYRRASSVSVQFGVYEDPESELGVAVAYNVKTDATVLDDMLNLFTATLDLAPLAPGKSGVATFAKTPGMFGSEFLKTASAAFREAYSGGRHAKTLKLTMNRTLKQNQSTIKSFTKRIEDHKSYISDPTSKYGDQWSMFSDARKQRELNHWNTEIKGFQEQVDITNDVIKSQ